MKRYAFITTVSPGFLFALNANFNTNKYYGTNADFCVLYDGYVAKDENDYMERCKDAFSFNIRWFSMGDFGDSYHSSKYRFAKYIQNEYDSVCLIDADLFICCNVIQLFEKAAIENVLISAGHAWSGEDITYLPFDNPDRMVDRGLCQLADFPVFINPKGNDKFFDDWVNGTLVSPSEEISHPLIAFNRAICRNFKLDQIIVLPGNLWVCDQNYWDIDYIRIADGRMVNSLGQTICAIHNKWWKLGRASGEWTASSHSQHFYEPEFQKRLDRGQNNFNAIKDFMSWFNDMTPATKRDDFFKEKHDWRTYLGVK
jgi:hypothetical protein